VHAVRLCATSRKDAGSIPDGVTVVNVPEVDSASNRNEYQEYFLGKIWEPQAPGTLMACPDLYRDYFDLILFLKEICLLTAKTGQRHTGVTSSQRY
jgi:hypothetical protein